MLTVDLVRARVRKGELRPSYIDPADEALLELAAALIEVFGAHVGAQYGDLREEVRAVVGDGPTAQVGRGLAKLLEDRCTIEMESDLDPRDVRRRLFETAAPHHPLSPHDRAHRTSRREILEAVAGELATSVEAVEAAMYADLPDAQVLKEARMPEPRWLLERYNVALAQAILLKAGVVRLEISGNTPARYRQLFRFIKFFRLMHQIEPLSDGFRIQLDGPLSLFKLSQKYGLQFAEFLPALLLCRGWRLEAEVEWGAAREVRRFGVRPEDGLRSHYPDKGVYETREETWFKERMGKLETPWVLEQTPAVLALGTQAVVVPDFALRHPDGRVAWLEIVGFWRRSYLERRLELYRAHGPGNLILAVSRQLQGSLEGLEGFEGAVYSFREVIVPRDIIELAERVGRMADAGKPLIDSSVAR